MASVLPEDDGLVAYTDGSGTIATRPCGAGVVVFDGRGAILEVSKHLGNGTNNYAELSAIRLALAVCGVVALQRRPLLIRTDSMYCIDSLTSAYDAHPMAPNAELINVIRDRMAKRGHVDFEHVKGHRGEPGNERADVLAGLARLRVPGQRELLP
jgi:ribonuclease HI